MQKRLAKELLVVAREVMGGAEAMDRNMIKGIYDLILDAAKDYRIVDPDGSVQCHASLQLVKDLYSDHWWFKKIKFHEWKEIDWKRVAQKLKDDNAIKRFSNRAVSELIEDISDFSVNGHSFMEYGGKFIDPYLKSKGVSDGMIQKFDKYFKAVM